MEVELKYAPSGTVAVCTLEGSDSLTAESGALLAIVGSVNIETTTHQKSGGGLLNGLKRVVAGESFFLNKYTPLRRSELWLCTRMPGDIFVKELNGEKLIVQGGSYLACEQGIHIDLEWQGLKSLFSGESLFWIKAKGRGKLLVSSFGFIYPIQVDGEHLVDTGHIVAFEETLNFQISKASRTWLGSFLSGEGFVCRFKGKGTVWCQSHNPRAFGAQLTPYLRPKKK